MDFILAEDFVKFFEYYEFDLVLEKFNFLIQFCRSNIQKSKLCKVQKELFTQKYLAVKKNLQKNKFYSAKLSCVFELLEQELLKLPPVLTLPLGRCHGDLTLSNVLFLKNKIVLIDFLDSFIESPLQDIVKLRQDTKHKWSLNLYSSPYDKTKIHIILDFLDEKIHKAFLNFDFYNLYYDFFQKMNLLRIMPYAKNYKIMSYLAKELLKLKEKQ